MFHVEQLAAMGIGSVVVNLAYLGEQIRRALGDGSTWNIRIRYSQEPEGALETGGGILQAFGYCQTDLVLVINGDVWTDLPLHQLSIPPASDAHLVLVPNPAHHPGGDFALSGDRLTGHGGPRFTYSGIGLFRRRFFQGQVAGRFPLGPLLRRRSEAGGITAEVYAGAWSDVGAPDRLARLDRRLRGLEPAEEAPLGT